MRRSPKDTGSGSTAAGDFFRVFENVVPELRGHIEGGGDAALAGGFVGFGQHVVEQHGHTLVFAALDVHRLRAVLQPCEGDIELPADVRDRAVARSFVTRTYSGYKRGGNVQPFSKLGFGDAEVRDKKCDSLVDRAHNFTFFLLTG